MSSTALSRSSDQPGGIALPRLLAAGHIAVVGASERSFVGTIVQRNLRRHGFPGVISQVNPRGGTVDGHPCAPSLSGLDGIPDLLCVLTATGRVADVLLEAEQLGVPWAVVPGGGQTESGDDAARLAAFLADPARTIRVLGPNCMGFLAPPERVTPYIGTAPHALRAGDAALVSQSGAVVEAFATQGSRVGYRLLISVGNQVHVGVEDVLELLIDEGRARVVMLWQEGVGQPERYLRLLGRAADADIRVAVVQAGRSKLSRAAAASHTGAISGDWHLWSQLMRRQGAAVLETLDELHEFGALAQHARRPVSRRVWAVTNSGGQGGQLADDLAASAHVELPAPSAAHAEAFAAAFPHAAPPRNPMDLWGLDDWETAYAKGCRLIAEHAGEGTLVAMIDAAPDQGAFEGELAAGVVRAACTAVAGDEGWRVVHVAPLAAPAHPTLAATLEELDCPSVRGAAGVRALAHLLAPCGPRIADERLTTLRGDHGEPGARMTHAEGLEALEAAGVSVPRTVLAETPEDAAAGAQSLTEPFVVKVIGPAHRARVGGVALGVPAAAVEQVCQDMAAIPGCQGFEITEYVVADLELLVSVALDPQLGARATLGVGGALAEQAAAAVCDLAPRTPDEAKDLVVRLVGQEGTAPEAAAWVAAVADALVGLGQLVERGGAGEVEINPLAVDRLRGRAVAVDVLANHAGGSK